jgi:hypothetical protein
MTPLRLIQRTLSPINGKKEYFHLRHIHILCKGDFHFQLAAKNDAEQLSTIYRSLRLTPSKPTNHLLPPQPPSSTEQQYNHPISSFQSSHPRPQKYPRNASTTVPSVSATDARADPTQALSRTGQALLIPSANPANHTLTPWGTRHDHDAPLQWGGPSSPERALLIHCRARVFIAFSQSPGFVLSNRLASE